MRATAIAAWAAHALAWGAGIWFAFAPIYQGVSVTATQPGEPAGESTLVTATLIEANGLYLVWWLLLPVMLTGIALLVVHRVSYGRAARKALLWISAVGLLGFCAVSIFSLGMFYLPAALSLLIAAIADMAAPDPQN